MAGPGEDDEVKTKTKTKRSGRGEYCVEDDDGNMLIWPSVTTRTVAHDAAVKLAEQRGESVYVLEVDEDGDGARIVVDREEIRPRGANLRAVRQRGRGSSSSSGPTLAEIERDVLEIARGDGRW